MTSHDSATKAGALASVERDENALGRSIAGMLLCGALALVANVTAPITGVPAMLTVLGLGLAMRALAPRLVQFGAAGVQSVASSGLRLGVAMLGLGVVVGDLAALGIRAVALVLLSLVVTLGGGYLLARLSGCDRRLAAISATSVGICGASAALAASSVLARDRKEEQQTVMIVVLVSLLSTVVMIVYPRFAEALHFDTQATALLFGAAIHDVAQVAGAGLTVSPEVGLLAVTVKMIRVACLLPVVLGLGWACARRRGTVLPQAAPPFPWFLLGFFALAAASSIGIVPVQFAAEGSMIARWLLAASVAALGLKTSLADLRTARFQLLLLLGGQTILQLATVVLLIYFLFE